MGNCLPSQGAGLDIEPVLSDEDIERLRTIFLGIADTETTDGQKALSITELLHMSALLGEPHTEVSRGRGRHSPVRRFLMLRCVWR